MAKRLTRRTEGRRFLLPVVIERDRDGYYAECPVLQGCYTQGDTYDEVMANIKDVLKLLKAIPEYRKSVSLQLPPKIVSGSEENRCGKIYVDMTGGTEGSKEVFEKFASSGVSTLVAMHISEDHLENAKKANLNVIIAGHIASDTLGLNLVFDEIEKKEKIDFVSVSGFERIRRLG